MISGGNEDDESTAESVTAPQPADSAAPAALVATAFGEQNRHRLIGDYFEYTDRPTTPATAWMHVYALLLWIDRTTGLAHCYESDKSQPGRLWYARALAFHDWLAREFEVEPTGIASRLDWMFQRAATELGAEVLRFSEKRAALASKQRGLYTDAFPEPGEDPELANIIREGLGGRLETEPTREEWSALNQRIRQYLTLDNKRKNLLGEGFEDVLGDVIRRACGTDRAVEVRVRAKLHDIPGFNRVRQGEKPNKVDVAILRPNRRTLVTAKWSVRADREKQFVVDHRDYVAAESSGKRFEYVFVTNEFDPARLMRACEKLIDNSEMFSHVVHVNTEGLRAAYGGKAERTMRTVLEFVESDRLISLEKWLRHLALP